MEKRQTATEPIQWATAQTILKLLKTEQRHKDRLLFGVGFYTGLRIGDILALRWEQVTDKKEITILEGKSQKPRKITFHRNLQSIFKETKAALPALAHFAIFAPDSNPAGEPVSTTAANKRINNVFKRYGIATQNPSSHTLRKTFARRVFEASGKNDEALMLLCEILNHEHTAVTRRYIGLTAERIKNIYLNL